MEELPTGWLLEANKLLMSLKLNEAQYANSANRTAMALEGTALERWPWRRRRGSHPLMARAVIAIRCAHRCEIKREEWVAAVRLCTEVLDVVREEIRLQASKRTLFGCRSPRSSKGDTVKV